MKKKIITLVVILMLLLIAILIKKISTPQIDIAQEIGLVKILPENFNIKDVVKIEIYNGGIPKKKVIIVKKEVKVKKEEKKEKNKKGVEEVKEKWIVLSNYNAPGNKREIENFLEELNKLQGEIRVAEKDILKDFKLEDKQALHFKLVLKNKKEFHILVGKKEEYKACFVRMSDNYKVYRVPVELRAKVGIWDEKSDVAPDNNRWLNKNIFNFDKNKVTKLALIYPDKKLVFKKEEKIVKEDKEKEKNKDKKNKDKNKDKKNKDKKKEVKEIKKIYEWKLVEGGITKDFKKSALDEILDELSKLDGVDIVDPSKKKEYGLDNPKFKIIIYFEDNKTKTLLASRPNLEEDGYAYLKDKPNLIYKIGSYTFEYRLFKSGSKFFKLPYCSIDKENIKTLKLKYYEDNTILIVNQEKNKDNKSKWVLTSPKTNLKFQSSVIDDVVLKLKYFSLDDYTDEKNIDKLGLSNPLYKIDILLNDDTNYIIKIGKPSLSVKGRYAIINNSQIIGVIKDSVLEDLFPKFNKLFDLNIIDAIGIKKLCIKKKDKEIILEKDEKDNWWVLKDNKKYKGDVPIIEELLKNFKPLEIKDVSFDKNIIKDKKTIASIIIEDTQGKNTLTLYERGKEQEYFPFIIENWNEVFYLEEEIAKQILRKPDIYISQEKEEKKQENQEKVEKNKENSSKNEKKQEKVEKKPKNQEKVEKKQEKVEKKQEKVEKKQENQEKVEKNKENSSKNEKK